MELGTYNQQGNKELQYKRSTILRDETLKELSIDGEFKGRGYRYLTIPSRNMVAALERVMELGIQVKEPLCAPAWKREWVDEHMQERQKANDSKEDISREIAAELAI